MNCRKSQDSGSSGKGSVGWAQGKNKGGNLQKGKGKGGKKGKMFAVFDEESETWWYCDATLPEETGEEDNSGEQSVLVISCVVGSSDVGLGTCDESMFKNEPNTQCESKPILEESHANPNDGKILASDLHDPAESNLLTGEHGEYSEKGGNSFFAPASGLFQIQPLLQSIGHSIGDDFWLIDSGASCCVMNQSTLKNFSHDEVTPCGATFTAANGTPVSFVGRCSVILKVKALDYNGKSQNGVFKIPVMVADTPFNILSTLSLGRLGWTIVLTEDVKVFHEKSEVTTVDTVMWCETPWVKVFPHHGKELLLPNVDLGDSLTGGHVCGIGGLKNRDELEVHRSKGHIPFHPDCERCQIKVGKPTS